MARSLTDAEFDLVSGGLKSGDPVGTTGLVYCTGDRAPAGDGVYAGPFCPGATNGEVYAAFFEGIKKGMGK